MQKNKLVELMSRSLIELNQSTDNKMSSPHVWARSGDDENDPVRKLTWANSDGGLLEMSIYDNEFIEFEVVAGDDEELLVLIGDVPSEVYSWDAFPRVILKSFCKL